MESRLAPHGGSDRFREDIEKKIEVVDLFNVTHERNLRMKGSRFRKRYVYGHAGLLCPR
jgi:hypothetical protein